MQFFTGILQNTQSNSKSYMLSLTECVWDFQNNALDINLHAILLSRLNLTKIKFIALVNYVRLAAEITSLPM